MIKEFDKTNLKTVRANLDGLLAAYAKQNGIELSIGVMSFTSGSFTTKITAKVIGATTPDDVELSEVASMYNLKTTGVDGRVMTKYNARARRYPFVYTKSGNTYKCSLESAKIYFAAL